MVARTRVWRGWPREPGRCDSQAPLDRALRRPRRARRRLSRLARRDGRAAAGQEMTRGDALMERGAGKLQRLADRAAASGGLAAKLAEPLAEDAALFRRMKPSLIAASVKGEAPTNLEP